MDVTAASVLLSAGNGGQGATASVASTAPLAVQTLRPARGRWAAATELQSLVLSRLRATGLDDERVGGGGGWPGWKYCRSGEQPNCGITMPSAVRATSARWPDDTQPQAEQEFRKAGHHQDDEDGGGELRREEVSEAVGPVADPPSIARNTPRTRGRHLARNTSLPRASIVPPKSAGATASPIPWI
jgi:hypothetical protein